MLTGMSSRFEKSRTSNPQDLPTFIHVDEAAHRFRLWSKTARYVHQMSGLRREYQSPKSGLTVRAIAFPWPWILHHCLAMNDDPLVGTYVPNFKEGL